MDAKGYVEWCELSGLYLKNYSHLDRYQTYAKSLSREGLNTVIVSDFLADISADLNVPDWRTYNVYEMGHQQTQRVDLTANALEAIGAVKIAEAVRTAKSHSPFDALGNLEGADPEAMMQALQDGNAMDMLNHLRESMARMMPEQAAEAGITPSSKDSFQPQAGWGYESREEVERLLEQYATANEEKLASDIEKYGDPREVPGFTREKRLAELELEQERQASHDAQRDDCGKLKSQMANVEKLIETDSNKKSERKLDSVRRKFLKLVKRIRRHPSEMMLPETQTLLNEAEDFMCRYSDVFHRQATDDEQLQARLSAIGEYEIDIHGDEVHLHWDDPIGLPCDWGQFRLTLIYPSNKEGKKKPLIALMDAFDQIQKHFAELSSNWREQLIDHFRHYEVQMSDWELEDYELNADDEVTEESILQNAGAGTIVLQVFDSYEEDIAAETYFSVEWDQEHGFQLEWEIPADESEVKGEEFACGDVKIIAAGPSIGETDITAFEERFNIQLPAAYRQFLLRHNGGKPEPNHIILRVHGEKIPFDVDRFYSLTGDDSENSLAGALESARKSSMPELILPIAGVTYSAATFRQKPQLCLVLSGKKANRLLLIEAETLLFPASSFEMARDSSMLAEMRNHLVDDSLMVAKDINDLFGRFRERPTEAIPLWLALIRKDDVVGFVEWLENGGKLTEQHTGYGEHFPKSVVDYLTQEASVELLRELLDRKAIKPSRIRDSWLQCSLLDIGRYRQLMPILPKQVWPAVMASPLVWTEMDLLEELAAAGVDFNSSVDREGRTPLHHAVEVGNKEAVKWLMNHGADPHRHDKYARDAFVWAESAPGFDCLPILEGKDENPEPTRDPSPDASGIGVLKEAADGLPEDVSLMISLQIKSPPVTRVEKAYYAECHYLLSIDISRGQVTFKDMTTPRQDYLYADEWPSILFAPILQWPELTPLWDTLEVRALDWQQAMRKRKYEGDIREDLADAARSALEQAFDPAEAEARGFRLRKL